MMLFRANPEAIALPDNKGILPFFHACLNNTSSHETLMLFVKLYPESIVSSQSMDYNASSNSRSRFDSSKENFPTDWRSMNAIDY
jgi:hypothetical protein